MAARPYSPYGHFRLDLFHYLYVFPFSYVLYPTPAVRLLGRALSLVPLVSHQYDNQCTTRTMYLPLGGPSEALRRTNTFLCLPISASCLKNRPRIALGPLHRVTAQATDLSHGRSSVESALRRRYRRSGMSESEQETHSGDWSTSEWAYCQPNDGEWPIAGTEARSKLRLHGRLLQQLGVCPVSRLPRCPRL